MMSVKKTSTKLEARVEERCKVKFALAGANFTVKAITHVGGDIFRFEDWRISSCSLSYRECYRLMSQAIIEVMQKDSFNLN